MWRSGKLIVLSSGSEWVRQWPVTVRHVEEDDDGGSLFLLVVWPSARGGRTDSLTWTAMGRSG
jgi:hypothetical protein